MQEERWNQSEGKDLSTWSQQQQRKQKATKFPAAERLVTKPHGRQQQKLIKEWGGGDLYQKTKACVLRPKTDLFGALAHNDAAPLIILQRAVGMPYHLQHVVDGVVHVPGDRGERQRWINTGTHSGRFDSEVRMRSQHGKTWAHHSKLCL